jgi:hypothetical protein
MVPISHALFTITVDIDFRPMYARKSTDIPEQDYSSEESPVGCLVLAVLGVSSRPIVDVNTLSIQRRKRLVL